MLVNNAGQGAPLPALDLAIESTVKDIYDVNVFGVMRMVQAFAPLLIAAQGTIVNIGSIAPLVPLVFGSAYSSSKAAVHAYSDCLRIEMKPFGVRVLVVVTGGVKSGIVRPGMEVLPENSLYTPIREFYIKRVVVSQGTESMETETYAKGVVARVVSGSAKPLLWWGYFAWGAWALQTFTWKGFTVSEPARRGLGGERAGGGEG